MEDTERVLGWFRRIAAIPRTSGREAQVRTFLADWATESGLETRTDAVGNLLVRKKGQGAVATREPVALQAHLDMVAEKNQGTRHDFLCDPIRLKTEGDWLKADGTTLGADNGAGLALILDVLEDAKASHPPLEALFTVDEETGLTGALGLDPSLLTSRRLLNLDSEETGVFTIGCAGGLTGILKLRLPLSPVSGNLVCRRLEIGGLPGGHSGTEIHRRLGNSLVLLARLMNSNAGLGPWRLTAAGGGDKHNAIPREAWFEAYGSAESWAQVEAGLPGWKAIFTEELGEAGNRLALRVVPAPPGPAAHDIAFGRVRDLLLALPHGVASMSPSVEGLVESSSNLAALNWLPEKDEAVVKVLFSVRSDRPSLIESLTAKYAAVGRLVGARLETKDGYPSWTPRPDSTLLRQATEVWTLLTGKAPRVETVHAGLECGVIGSKIPAMDMLSFGPDIRGAHTPEERLHLPSLGLMRGFLRNFLEALP